MPEKVKLSALLAGAAIAPWLLTVTGLPSTAQESPAKDEVFGVTSVIKPLDSQKFTSFDISFVDPANGVYLLADRTNKAIDVVDTGTNTLTHQLMPGFVGPVACPDGTANDCAGPDGVLVANGHQVWVGDGMSRVWVLDLTSSPPGKPLTMAPISTAIKGAGTDPTRADELCWDSKNQIILVANDASKPSPFVTFISSTSFGFLGRIVLDGTNGTPNATGGIEQCQWSPKTGKFYLNVPNPSGANSKDGVVLQIDPVSRTIEQTFSLAGSGCGGNNGMALGPFPQALLGCTNGGPNSVILNLKSGAITQLAGEAGADEVWYNPGDNQYFLASGNHKPGPILGVVDAAGKKEDFSPTSAVGSHSVAADPVKGQVYVPINSTTGAASMICSTHGGTDANGCIAVFTVISGKDDKGKCVAQGAPVKGMNDGESNPMKVNCSDNAPGKDNQDAQ
jgi:hypothetical protein